MSDKNTAQVEKKPELLVCNLEWDKIMLAGSQIQVIGFDPRILRHIIDNWFLDGDVVIDERGTLLYSHASQHGNPSEPTPAWPNNLLRPISFDINLCLFKIDKLRVKGDRSARCWLFRVSQCTA